MPQTLLRFYRARKGNIANAVRTRRVFLPSPLPSRLPPLSAPPIPARLKGNIANAVRPRRLLLPPPLPFPLSALPIPRRHI